MTGRLDRDKGECQSVDERELGWMMKWEVRMGNGVEDMREKQYQGRVYEGEVKAREGKS